MVSAAPARRYGEPGLHLHRHRCHRLRQLQRAVRDVPDPRFPRHLRHQQLHLGPRARHRHHLAGHQLQYGLDVYNLQNNYGPQSFDIKFIYNFGLVLHARSGSVGQKGVVGHVLGGWTFSPLFTAQSGSPISVTIARAVRNGSQAFGEVSTTSSATSAFTTNAQGAGPTPAADRPIYNSRRRQRRRNQQPGGVNMFSRSGGGARAVPQVRARLRHQLRRLRSARPAALERGSRRSARTSRSDGRQWAPTAASSSPTF